MGSEGAEHELLTLQEAAESLGVEPVTLRVALFRGRVEGVKRGPLWFVTRAEIERYRRDQLGRHGPKGDR